MTLTKYSYQHPTPFQLESGQYLPTLELIYHSSVEPSQMAAQIASGRRVVWVCHALTANSDPSEWWSDLVGKGQCFDTQRDVIICANTIGSCYGSTSPCNWGGKPLDFPRFTVRDIVRAIICLRKHLEIDHIDILVGGSVGGFQSLEWSIIEPDVIRNMVLIACNHRISPWCTAFNESQRMAIEADSSFAEQASLEGGAKGLRAARAMALLSYRSYYCYNSTQYERDDDCAQALRAASYQNYQGEKLVKRFDAYSYYLMTLMLDTHNVGRGRGGVAAALAGVKAKTLLISISSDVLCPPTELSATSELIEGSRFVSIDSDFGHDGFLIEWRIIERAVIDFLNS